MTMLIPAWVLKITPTTDGVWARGAPSLWQLTILNVLLFLGWCWRLGRI